MILHYVDLAIEQAKKSEMYHRHGAILFFRRRVYSQGHNKFDTFAISTHAEIDCSLKIKDKKKLPHVYLLVIRLNGNDKLANSKPCKHCLEKLKKIGIKRVYYSDSNGNIVYEKIKYATSNHISSGVKFGKR